MKKKKRLLYIGMGVGGVGISFFIYSMVHTPLVGTPQKKVTLYPTQYSDTHITKNAMETDRRFKDLTVFDKENFLASVASPLVADTPSPESLTFYNTSLSSLNTEIQNIQEAFAKDTSYNGIAIHYINTLMELK